MRRILNSNYQTMKVDTPDINPSCILGLGVGGDEFINSDPATLPVTSYMNSNAKPTICNFSSSVPPAYFSLFEGCYYPVWTFSPQAESAVGNQINNVCHFENQDVQLKVAQHPETNDCLQEREQTLFVKPVKPKRIRIRKRERDCSGLVAILQKPTKKSRFTATQTEPLLATWESTQFPSAPEVNELVRTTGLTKEQVKNWFQNRRGLSRLRAKQDELSHRPLEEQRRVTGAGLSKSHNNSAGSTGKFQSSVNDLDSSNSQGQGTQLKSSAHNLNEKAKRERRINAIKYIPVSTLEECMEANKARLSQLILMYMKRKYNMAKTLLRETMKLKERTAISPFNPIQLHAMKRWRDDFFREVGEELDEEKKQKLICVKSNVIEVWQPVITYGKLAKTSLDIAIDDLSHMNDVDTSIIADPEEEFTIPGILRYMESHFNQV